MGDLAPSSTSAEGAPKVSACWITYISTPGRKSAEVSGDTKHNLYYTKTIIMKALRVSTTKKCQPATEHGLLKLLPAPAQHKRCNAVIMDLLPTSTAACKRPDNSVLPNNLAALSLHMMLTLLL